MANSFERINYALRPAKSVERKMLCDCFRRLSPIAQVDTYRYVGFGSPYFSDFSLMHRALGITDLVSIEKATNEKDRFELNRPYRSIELMWGESTELLPEFDWEARTILWLDYDGKLNSDVLADIATFCRACTGGSVLVVSVNVHPDRGDDEQRLAALRERVGAAKVPHDVDPKRLAGWDLASLCRRIIGAEIASTLSGRNGARPPNTHLRYKQLFNFNYRDGARMLTTGGIVYDAGQEHLVNYCGFEQMDFVRDGERPYEIVVPNLTFREMRHVDAQLPSAPGQILDAPIKADDLEAYKAIYRYFPRFVEAEL